MGESSGSTGRSLVRTSALPGDDINECISLDDLNQTTSSNYIIPSSKDAGAVPSAVISGGTKCVTQAYLDSLYANKIINVNTNIHKKTSSGGTLVAMPYSITITADYDNALLGTVDPRFSNIYTDLKVMVNFTRGRTSLLSYASETYTLPASPNSEGKLTFDLLLGYGGSNVNSESTTGSMSVNDFLNENLSGMYNQYSAGSVGNYSISVSITPEYNFLPNTPYKPHKYICYHNITTTTGSAGSSMTQLRFNYVYNCTSNPIGTNASLIPGQTYTWEFTITMNNFSPTPSSSPANDVTLSNGGGTDNMNISVNKSWNSSTKTLTITGTATCIPTSSLVPALKLTYSKSGNYTPFVRSFSLSLDS